MPHVLEIALKAKPEWLMKDRVDQPPFRLSPQKQTVSVWVVITDETDGPAGPAFGFDHRFAELRVPITGDSKGSAKLKITPLSRGWLRGRTGRLGIRLYHKLNLIDHLELDLRAGPRGEAKSAAGDPAIKVALKHPGAKHSVEALDPGSQVRALTINISKADHETYRFALVAGRNDNPGEPSISATRKLPEGVLNDFVVGFREILLDTVFGASLSKVALSVSERDELLTRLSLLGTRIVTHLFDFMNRSDFFALDAILRDALAEAAIIQIALSKDAEDFVFPWQILTVNPYTDEAKNPDPTNLWGFRFVIEVKRCGDGVDPRPHEARSCGPLRMTYGRWHFKNEPEHYASLKDMITSMVVPAQLADPVVETRDDWLDALRNGGGDLLYVYAHGLGAAPNTPAGLRSRDQARQQIAAIADKLKSHPLASSTNQAEELEHLDRFLRVTKDHAQSSLTFSKAEVSLTSLLNAVGPGCLFDAPIVFLNTCESAQIWNAVEDSFVAFFLTRGARAVLGTESTIPVLLADAFGRTVLRALFAGDTIGEAVHKARLDLLRQSRNPLGLCYSIYGAADARLPLPKHELNEEQR